MTLSDIGDLLVTITPNTFHYQALEQTESYIVWAEDGQGDSSHADNKMNLQAIQGTIDYFTTIEFDPVFNAIQNTLNGSDLFWRLNSIQRETETGYIHFEWVWEVSNKVG